MTAPDRSRDHVEDPAAVWARELYRLSVQKQEKLAAITRVLGVVEGATCLDVGGDNGVISYMLRGIGGTWHSVDLDAATVEAIQSIVRKRVRRMRGTSLPFEDATFDVVVVVDLLEHLEDDRAFVAELRRVLVPGGRLVVNVPRRRTTSLLHRIRERLGIGDERHGHVRPGYTREELEALLAPEFRVEAEDGYSHWPLESLDVLLNAAYALIRGVDADEERAWGAESDKGALVTVADWDRHQKKFRILRALRPAFEAVRFLDQRVPMATSHKLVLAARRVGETSGGAGGP